MTRRRSTSAARRASSTRWPAFSDDAAARRHARRVHRGRPARARVSSRACARTPGSTCARTRSATRSRAGRAPSPTCPPSPPARTSTRFRTPAATTAPSACSAASRRSARCSARGFQPRRSIELVLFTSEEPTRFGIGCLGSRLLSGTLDASAGDSCADRDGRIAGRGARGGRLHGTARLGARCRRTPTARVRRAAHRAGAAARAAAASTSASSRRSPRRRACGFSSKARAATPARC